MICEKFVIIQNENISLLGRTFLDKTSASLTFRNRKIFIKFKKSYLHEDSQLQRRAHLITKSLKNYNTSVKKYTGKCHDLLRKMTNIPNLCIICYQQLTIYDVKQIELPYGIIVYLFKIPLCLEHKTLTENRKFYFKIIRQSNCMRLGNLLKGNYCISQGFNFVLAHLANARGVVKSPSAARPLTIKITLLSNLDNNKSFSYFGPEKIEYFSGRKELSKLGLKNFIHAMCTGLGEFLKSIKTCIGNVIPESSPILVENPASTHILSNSVRVRLYFPDSLIGRFRE